MLFNFGVLKTLLLAWVHLPSLAGFNDLQLPYMRAFIPVIPCTLLLAYLGLQMEALRRSKLIVWIAMAVLQLCALAIFPYATAMMAGLTAVSLLGRVMRLGWRETWRVPLLYGATCGLLDFAFLGHGSLGFYDNRSSAIHFQPQLLPHLIGGNWLLLVALTVAVAFAKPLVFELKWPLVGLGATNALFMLGDVIVPSTAILLSHHVSHFLHMTVAILTPFLIAAAISAFPVNPRIAHIVLGFLGTYSSKRSVAGSRNLPAVPAAEPRNRRTFAAAAPDQPYGQGPSDCTFGDCRRLLRLGRPHVSVPGIVLHGCRSDAYATTEPRHSPFPSSRISLSDWKKQRSDAASTRWP
jgi:hypothetical protein